MKKDILEKIKKLMALAQSPNPNEAASALRKARALMDKYRIDQQQLVESDIHESGVKVGRYKKPPVHHVVLGNVIAELFSCECFCDVDTWFELRSCVRKYEARLVFIGFSPDAEVAQYCFDVLLRQLNKARREYRKQSRRRSRALLIQELDSYCLGWVIGVKNKVANMVPDKAEVLPGMQMTKRQALDHYVQKKTGGQTIAGRSNKMHNGAASRGYADGKKAEIHHGVGSQEQLKIK